MLYTAPISAGDPGITEPEWLPGGKDLRDVALQLRLMLDGGISFAIATVVDTRGSALRRPGTVVVISEQGQTIGFNPAGPLDKAIREAREEAAAKANTTALPLVPWTIHDLRRTVATGLQRLGVRLEVTEAVLNHISGSRGGIAGVYQRHDWAPERRAALDAWAAHVLAIVEQRTAADNVVKLARAG